MKLFKGKKQLFLIYIFFALWAGAVFGFNRYSETSSLSLMLTFFLLLMAPGFCLARIFKIELKDEKIGQLILWITLGLLLAFSCAFLALVLSWTLNNLNYIYFIVVGLLALIALILDFWRPPSQISYLKGAPLTFKDIFNPDLLFYFLLAILIILILTTVDFLGTYFKGDPSFHLAIMRKIIGGQPLNPENLNFVKGSLHSAYAFPVWHIFMTMLASFLNINIFSVFRELPLTLTGLTTLIWYWLFRKLFPTRGLAILATLLFLIFIYSIFEPGYLFTRLPVPDTLCQLILLPLTISLALKYIFDRSTSYKILIVFSILVIFMGIIHATQYFYYIIMMVFLAIFYGILKFSEPDFKSVFKRILLAIFGNMVMILPFVIFLEFHGKTVSSTIKGFLDNKEPKIMFLSLDRMRLLAKFDYLFLPLVLLFIKKYPRLIFLLALFLIMPLLYWIPFPRYWLGRFIGLIFINRLFDNVNWSFAIWALVLGFVIILIDRLISKMTSFSRYLRYLIDFIFSLGAFWMIWLEEKHKGVSLFYSKVFSSDLDMWLGRNYYWLILIILVLVLIILLLQRRFPKIGDFFTLTEFRNRYASFVLIFSLIFFLNAPMYSSLWYYFEFEVSLKHFIAKVGDPFYSIINPIVYGGPQTENFINKNIPPKSVILTRGIGDYTLSLVADLYMVAYTDSTLEGKYNKIYQKEIPIEEKLNYLKTGNIEYILDNSQLFDIKETGLDDYPQYFIQIFKTTETYKVAGIDYQAEFKIYKINTANMERDLNL